VTSSVARAAVALAVAVLLLAASACGGGESSTNDLVGYRTGAEQRVDTASLPDAANGDAPFAFRAEPGHLLVVFFGFTQCPDVCPTTLEAIRSGLRQLGTQADEVNVAMVTIDPDRDTGPVLTSYVQRVVPGAHALRTDDPAELAQAADVFGVSYDMSTNTAGKVVVGHTDLLYVVDETGMLRLTWTFGVSASDIANDLKILLAE
jgi:protein SCO1/2